ncbi:sigma-70 family RNA polymerase sigma factor [Peptostreptococcaceae bacterium OttesenSCG-928-C18]|nr:sigma-70 family RNA polymerase sigma factor [Peptostreptococcaceae bacterium OttesenSCG-928-C18]
MSKKWYIWLDGKEIPVTEEVYRTYKRAEWREEKQDVVRATRECSYDFMLENDFDGQADTNQKLVDEIVEDKLLLDILLTALDELTADERSLIDALFYQEKSEREVANQKGISHQAVHKKKVRILEKLKKLLNS